MTNVHFDIGSPSDMGYTPTKELLAIQGATAIVAQIVETHVGVFLKGTEWDYEKLEKFIAVTKKALAAESEQEEN